VGLANGAPIGGPVGRGLERKRCAHEA
jgi:hypothetical protein